MSGIVDLAVSIALLACGMFLLWAIPLPGQLSDDPEGTPADVSVIIPARNEEANISRLLSSLAEQTRAPTEVIVVDDGSTDGTAAIAVEHGATVLSGQPLPDGWAGKPWACWQGAQRAKGDHLLFLDADTWLETEGLARLLRSFLPGRGLLSVQPFHVTSCGYEQLSSVFNIILMMGMNAFTPLGHAIAPSGSFGPCLITRRDSYIRVGGHSSDQVRGFVLESIPLAQAYLAHGLPVRCFGGKGTISFRMYPDGLTQLIEGWSKGFGSGALAIRWPYLLLSVAWITGCFHAFGGLIRALVTAQAPWLVWPYALVYGLFALQMAWMLGRIGRFRSWTWALYFVPLSFFTLIMTRSMVLIHLLRRVSWKGRTVHVDRKRHPEV